MVSGELIEDVKEKIASEFSDYYEHAGGYEYRYHHLIRVHRYVQSLMQKPEIKSIEFDSVVVELGALLHDIGRAEDIDEGYLDPFESNEYHAERGAERIEEFVDGLSEERLELLRKVVANHHSSPETVEGKIVQDADRLDFFGSHNIWRMFHYSSDKESSLEEALRYFWGEAVERYEKELGKFHFDISKEIASDRLETHKETIEIIESEEKAEDF